jgi:hypothetical protein
VATQAIGEDREDEDADVKLHQLEIIYIGMNCFPMFFDGVHSKIDDKISKKELLCDFLRIIAHDLQEFTGLRLQSLIFLFLDTIGKEFHIFTGIFLKCLKLLFAGLHQGEDDLWK